MLALEGLVDNYQHFADWKKTDYAENDKPTAYLYLILPYFYVELHYNFKYIFDDLNIKFSNNRLTKIPENKQYFSSEHSI